VVEALGQLRGRGVKANPSAMSAKTLEAHRARNLERSFKFIRTQIVPRAVLIVGAAFFLSPLYWMVVTALKENTELTAFPPTLLPAHWRFDNFVSAVNEIPFWVYLKNTVVITFSSMVGAVFSNVLIAYGFSRIKWPGRDIVFGIVVATIFIPFPATLLPLFIIFAKLHWINTFLPLIVPTFFGNAFYIFLLRQFMMQIPLEISEAARVDGANEWQIFSRLIVPMSRPAIAVVALFSAIAAWNNFLGPLIYLNDDSLYPLSIGLQSFRSLHDVKWNLLMAASTLVVLPIIAVFLAFQRAFIEGITVGSVR
jgi:multiple sugar transport system permease protein